MPGILGTNANLSQDLTFLSQIAILLILFVGYKYVKEKKFRTHGRLMTIAVILHSITIFWVMIPSFIIYFDILVSNIFTPGVIITWIHAIVGLLAEVFGLFLIIEWRFRPPPKMICARRKWMMRPLFLLWTLALILGIAFYSYYYL
jgi:membrane-associated HD superfamily phosphohydrolase